ncbi:MAG: peptidase S1 [Rubricoccaceae bacterium]
MRTLILAAAVLALVPTASAQNFNLDPNYGTVSLSEGFTPDPFEIGVVGGGDQAVAASPECSYGNVSAAPDVRLQYDSSGLSDLFLSVVADGDTFLLVNLPDGSWICDDDSFGDLDPVLHIPSAPSGQYDIWIGAFARNAPEGTLYVSEIDPR